MQKLEILDKDGMGIAIQQEIRRSEESRYDYRLHGVLLVSQGYNVQSVVDDKQGLMVPSDAGSDRSDVN